MSYEYVRPGRRKDLTGKKFGSLSVLREVEPKISKSGKIVHRWECQCDCGKTMTTSRSNLTGGGTSSCGCMRLANPRHFLAPGMSQQNMLLRIYQRAASDRGHVWELTDEQFDTLIKRNCHFCGAAPAPPRRKKPLTRLYGEFRYNGIDRLDNTKGYTMGNVTTCCTRCNKMKLVSSPTEFLSHIQKILDFCRLNHSDYLKP